MCLKAAFAVSVWPRARRRDVGLHVDSVLGLRCGLADDTMLHKVWQCSADHGLGDAVTESESLRVRVGAGAELLALCLAAGAPT